MSAHADDRRWVGDAVATLHREAARSADTHLLHMRFAGFPGIDFYFKDEAAHPSGSLKHRLARSLFLYALCNGRLREGQAVVDASSGSTAISEAWFARLLGLPFTAVMPEGTSPGKIEALRALGAHCVLTPPGECTQARARSIAADGACFLDQFGLAERATDWRGNNNIAESILGQLESEAHPQPAWIVCGAGTGGTSATLGRYLRYRGLQTQLCVAEPADMVFADAWRRRDRDACSRADSVIEGIGRRCVEPSFQFDVVDEVIEVDDAASIAAMLLLEQRLGVRHGGSSGTNLVACLELATRMREAGTEGSIVTLLCDRGERYAGTLYDADWRAARGLDVAPWQQALTDALAAGTLVVPDAAN
ncbi:PLP-dependent cysteine synthase family protein [Thermomonas sp. HDW16]|uniref:PLP-dependent cysteine synthase family protein n=1 Tax=Thermomonas sp. HDW16 TaxID=2714945 RepID=UPI001408DAC5|nr:PLP-dependent cysteine synthase family protein [Thermomonas sp. HDW16]QIL20299.1 PLP-dependent cysteine synthase family protein [Thermomonas sp. HDW16]